MTTKELNRLGKKELLELLLEQTKRADLLQEELEKANEIIADRSIKLDNAGSIAQAALALNDIFAVAQKSADEYLENVKKMTADVDGICERKMAQASVQSDAMVAEATVRSQAMMAEASAKSEAMIAEATVKSEKMMADAQKKTDAILSEAKEKADMMIIKATVKSDAMVADATAKADTIIGSAEKETEQYWTKLKSNLDAYYQAHQGIQELLGGMSK